MIREHAFNSEWWGERVGFLEDQAFLELDSATQQEALARFAWVEYRDSMECGERLRSLLRAGFFQADTQVPFRIGLKDLVLSPSLDALSVEFADETSFSVAAEEIVPFEHERFSHLPGVGPEKIVRRYALWANRLLEAQPAWCLRVFYDGEPQGWFLAAPEPGGLDLTLAMLRQGARISGMHLYQRALVAFGSRGARIGSARFSVTNTAILNIYAGLGARFLAPVGYWFWIHSPHERPEPA